MIPKLPSSSKTFWLYYSDSKKSRSYEGLKFIILHYKNLNESQEQV